MADSVNEARDKLESGISGSGQKWRSGVQNPTQSPSSGLTEISGFDMAGRGSEFDSHWESQANTQEAQDEFEGSASDAGSKWEQNWADASNWNIGGN